MKRKIFIRFFAVTLVAVLLMFAFGIIAVNINTKNVLKERLKEETELAAELWKDKGEFASFKKYENNLELRITVFDLDGNVLLSNDCFTGMKLVEGKITLNDLPGLGVSPI